MMRRGIPTAMALVLLGVTLAGPAAAADSMAPPETAGTDPAPADMPPAPARPWLVTRHPVGDSAAHVLDAGFAPLYWAGASGWWWVERTLYRDPPPRVRVRMLMHAEPPTP